VVVVSPTVNERRRVSSRSSPMFAATYVTPGRSVIVVR
jgi:hypothetical protein